MRFKSRGGRRALGGLAGAAAVALVALGSSASCVKAQESELPLARIKLPPGFKIEVFASGVQGARQMALGDRGTLFVGTMRLGRVYAIVDRDQDGHADGGYVLGGGFVAPNGVAFKDGSLYVGDAWRILRFAGIEEKLDKPPAPTTVYDQFPHEGHHGWKYIRFGPDGLLYVPVGGPCNVCEKEDPFASITRMRPDGTGLEVFARGVRNSVGFDWSPKTNELWFTDNGRDSLGDDSPPDELNHAPKPGLHFGFPWCHAGRIPDPDLGEKRGCVGFRPPAVELGPHVAALGFRFYRGKQFPAEYRNTILLAEHGSWNRSTPLGYRLMWVRPEAPEGERYKIFAEGWLDADGNRWGRPVDVLENPDGSLFVSDDEAGVIYRIAYQAAKP